MTVERFNSEEMFGYKQITTFYEDFSIADNFGKRAIVDTYMRAFKSWKSNVQYFTELVMVLNWKIWRWYEENDEYAKVYQELWEKADAYAMDNFKDDDLAYFLRTTD